MTSPDISAYLEIRTAGASGFSSDADTVLVSSDLPGTAQLFRVPRTGGSLTQVTAFGEPVGGQFVPGEDRLLLALDDGGNERYQLYLGDPDPAEPHASTEGLDVVVENPEYIHRPGGVSRDGRLIAYSTNRRNGVDFDVHVHDLETGEDVAVDTGGGWRGGMGFSPDGRWVAVYELTERSGDNRVHLHDRETGEHFELDPHDDTEDAVVGGPSWLPDGSAFFYESSVDRDTVAIRRFDMVARRAETVLEPEWDASCGVDWTGRHLLVVTNDDGYTRAVLHDPGTLAVRGEVRLPGEGVAGGFRFSRDGRYLQFSYSSPLMPGDVWVHDIEAASSERLTTSPCDVDPDTFVDAELHRYASFDGLDVPLYVFRPRERPSGSPLPVVVVIHGGPESQYRPSFSALTQYLVANGFAVVAPNVRGSTGYGKRYQHLDDVERRLDSVRDLEGLHDWIAGTDDLDADRAALYGGSYGGYMVLAGLAFQPDRWAAGVDIVGISSLVTFLENTSPWRRAFREREYGSLEQDREFLLEASPITHIDAIRAPLFMIHGANDPRVPVGEAEQIHEELESRGVPSELLVYDDEGHGLAKLRNRLDAYPRVVDFLTEVLRG